MTADETCGATTTPHGTHQADSAVFQATVAFERGDHDEARALLDEAVRQRPDDARLLGYRAALLVELGRLPAAERDLVVAVALCPTDAELHRDYSALLRRLERHSEAAGELERVVGLLPSDPEAWRELAMCHQEAGNWANAERAYLTSIDLDPHQATTRHNLGALLHAMGKVTSSEDQYRAALAIDPAVATTWKNLAVLLMNDPTRVAEAIEAARKGVTLSQNEGATHCVLGTALLAAGAHDDAALSLSRACQLQPADAVAWFNLGKCRVQKCQFEEGVNCFQRALRLAPRAPEILAALGAALMSSRRSHEAIGYLRRALEMAPDLLEANIAFGCCLVMENQCSEAIPVLTRLSSEHGERVDVRCALAHALILSAKVEEAADATRRAMAELPPHASLHFVMAACLTRLGRFSESIAELDKASAMRPDWAEPHFARAISLFFSGRLREAWPHYEWRWKHPVMATWDPMADKPRWNGDLLHGARILLRAEQGLGDTIHMIRYAALVAQRGGRVIAQVQRGLGALVASTPGVSSVVEEGEPLPQFEVQAPLMSLPGIFETSLETIPSNVPYLAPNPDKVAAWRSTLRGSAEGLAVGIVWEGGATMKENALRSASLRDFLPLTRVRGVQLFSLQKGPASQQAKSAPTGMHIRDLDPLISDFQDTAAAIMNLDLVVAVDTSVVHVAGALAKPVWNLVAHNWTGHMWMSGRSDSPWYPTMRLFRQTRLGDWGPVMEAVASELERLVHT